MEYGASDIETTSRGEFICISYYDDIVSEVFTDLNDYFDFIKKEKLKRIYFHYGGGFDFLILIPHLKLRNDFKIVSFLDVNGLIYSMIWQYGNYQVEFRDSFPLFRKSLDVVAEKLIGERKNNLAEHREHLEDFNINEVKKYCLNDAAILYRSLREFEKLLNMDLKISAPAQALAYFKKNYLDKYSIMKDIIPFKMKWLNILRTWYYGGHVDVFKRYGENLYEYDIVNCYGASMINAGALIGFPKMTNKVFSGDKYGGLYIVQIKDNMLFPHLPIKYNGKLYFLNTRKFLYCTDLDIQYLNDIGVNFKVINGYLFRKEKDFFVDYINYWYEQRFKNKQLEFVAKLMINSLYGKFGQNPERISAKIVDKENFSGKFYDEELGIGRIKSINLRWFLQPQIAAYITSYARIILHNFMRKNNGNLYYCDTDSIFTDKEFNEKYLTSKKELGKLELENKIEKGYFLGCKFYGLKIDGKFKVKAKGFQKKDFDEKLFEDALLNGNILFESETKFVKKFKSSLMSSQEWIQFQNIKKQVREFSLKRKLLPDKINTVPYFLTFNNKLQ